MPAGLLNNDAMFSVREMPWHQLVEPLPDYPTRAEAQAIAHPWEPEADPLYRKVIAMYEGILGPQPVWEYEEVDDAVGLYRSDDHTYLGTVSKSRGIVFNNDLWDIAEAVQGIDTGLVKYETAGSIHGGKSVWILVRFAEPLTVPGDPHGETLAFLCIRNSHSEAGSLAADAINTRVVCANTFVAGEAEARQRGTTFSFRHGKNVRDRIEEAQTAVARWRGQVTVWQERMAELVNLRVTDDQVRLFVEQFQPMPPPHRTSTRTENNVERARRQVTRILDGETCADIRNTAYGLVQAGLEYDQHYRAVKARGASAKMEQRFRRAMLTNDHLSFDLVELAVEVAKS